MSFGQILSTTHLMEKDKITLSIRIMTYSGCYLVLSDYCNIINLKIIIYSISFHGIKMYLFILIILILTDENH